MKHQTTKSLELYDDLQLFLSKNPNKIELEVLYLPRPASDYKGCFPLHFEKHLPRLLNTYDYVHFFSGKAKTGYKIDRRAELNPDFVGDVQKLPKSLPGRGMRLFGGGVADPPYTKEFAETLYNCEYPNWSKWTAELVSWVEPGGLIGILHNYPVPRLTGCKYKKLVIIINRIKQYVKVFTIQEKL